MITKARVDITLLDRIIERSDRWQRRAMDAEAKLRRLQEAKK